MPNDPVEDLLSQYDDLAIEILADKEPNHGVGLPLSNADLTESVCNILDWEFFNLFEEYNFAHFYEQGEEIEVLAYCYIAFLNWQVWVEAQTRGIGNDEFSMKAEANSEYWFLKLRDRYWSLVAREETTHPWLQ